ncbi:aspartyl protease [Winogradskyella wandonensis]|uniref:Aspartyl protease n=1 Tax=Winogradskyella wandonensis TaxID=1442586 RepID=A0A4R1KL88_9FLAO|nr:retropepsin-like aspartic protease [Winogradskyella wandonensis]TCK65053.1 aspartyl protease [Winogradskyella wandonensis]
MQDTLSEFLIAKGYFKTKLKLTKTNHFEIKAKINGIAGTFILDTGASSTCVDFNSAEKFKLKVKDSDIKAIGAGASDMLTKISKSNTIKIGRWQKEKVSIVIFDLNHVNEGLILHDAKAVDGIIGADILKKGKSIIDYDKKFLYLQKTKK